MSAFSRAVTHLAVAAIYLYRWTLGAILPGVCRFEPSCSRYAEAALKTHGPIRGGWKSLRRLLRCHPFHPGGLDPVD